MNAWSAVRILAAYGVAVAPWICILLLLPLVGKNSPILRRLPVVAAVATAVATVMACAITANGILLPPMLQLALAATGLALILPRMRGSPAPVPEDRRMALLLCIAFVVRLVPMLTGDESFGGGDARFHNILAEKIRRTGELSYSWAPFADIPVTYPQGVHAFIALVSTLAGCPVHDVLNVLIAIVGTLTVGVIYALSAHVFGNARSGLAAAACYAFLPFWGSLDTFRWGGLPNATGMLFLCVVLLLVLRAVGASALQRSVGTLLAAFMCIAIVLTHHYSMLVLALTLTACLVASPDTELRQMLRHVIILAAVACAPLLVTHYATVAGDIAATSIMQFREPYISVATCIQSINPAFVALFAAVIWLQRRVEWQRGQVLCFAWFTSLLVAYVGLEYVYRLGVLLATSGGDWFSALTPSRMATDMVYPMSVLLGWLPMIDTTRTRRRQFTAVFALFAVISVAAAWRQQWTVGEHPYTARPARWLHQNTPASALVVGSLPHLEYLSWRETTLPPLPASEQRLSPAVTWKARPHTEEQWRAWQYRNARPVYLIQNASSPATAATRTVYSDTYFAIRTLDEGSHR